MSYPAPPWETVGFGAFRAFRVRASEVELPAQLSVVTHFGAAVGLLAYLEYGPGSPLTYNEVIWMPAMVRTRKRGGGTTRGYWVAKMYVDDERSLEAGRTEWALPKALARFERDGERIIMDAEDAHLELRIRQWGPRLPIRSSMATLQIDGDELVRFRATFRGRVRMGSVSVDRFDGSWGSFSSAKALPATSVILSSFASTMHAPLRTAVAT